jgi:hypothetical protein
MRRAVDDKAKHFWSPTMKSYSMAQNRGNLRPTMSFKASTRRKQLVFRRACSCIKKGLSRAVLTWSHAGGRRGDSILNMMRAGRRQSGMDARRGQPTLHRDLTHEGRVWSAFHLAGCCRLDAGTDDVPLTVTETELGPAQVLDFVRACHRQHGDFDGTSALVGDGRQLAYERRHILV